MNPGVATARLNPISEFWHATLRIIANNSTGCTKEDPLQLQGISTHNIRKIFMPRMRDRFSALWCST